VPALLTAVEDGLLRSSADMAWLMIYDADGPSAGDRVVESPHAP